MSDRVTSAADAMLQLSSSFPHARVDTKPIIVTDSTSQMEDESHLKRARSFVPEMLKDDTYWQKRRKNNEAAKKSREKRRALDRRLADEVDDLRRDNEELHQELEALKKYIGYPLTVKFNPSIAHLIARKNDGPVVVQPASPTENAIPTPLARVQPPSAPPVANAAATNQLAKLFLASQNGSHAIAPVMQPEQRLETQAPLLRRTQSECAADHSRTDSTPSPLTSSTSDVIDLTEQDADKQQDDVTQHLHHIPHKWRLKQTLTRRMGRLTSEGHVRHDDADAQLAQSDSDSSGIGSCDAQSEAQVSTPPSDVTGNMLRENSTLKTEMHKLSEEVKHLKELIHKNIDAK